jgi:hypothetical protein
MATKVFKTNASYLTTITFYDNYQRKDGYAPASVVNIPDRTYSFTNFISNIGWTLSNVAALTEIPDWAFYYSVNITKCLRTRFFLQLRGLDATYVKKDLDGNFTFSNPVYSSAFAGCAFDISTLVPLNMGYVFAQGDLVKIYIGANVYTLAIIAQDGNWIITELRDLGNLSGSTPFLFEIYTPYKPSATEPAFEVSQIFPIINPGTNTRTYSTLSGTIAGDVYLVNRPLPDRNYYTIPTGTISGVGDHTLGVAYQSQDASDPNFTPGSSPLQNLTGFNPATNNDRWLIHTVNATTYRVSGTITVQSSIVSGDPFYEVDLLDNNGNIWAIVPRQTVTSYVYHTFNFDIDIPLAAGGKLFIWALLTGGASTSYQLTALTITVLSSTLTYQAEAMSPNDKFYKNWFTDAGRVNNVDTIGQVTKTNSIAYSNTLVAGSKVNGLSTFDALDEGAAVVPQECGAIRKLQLTSKVAGQGPGNVMLAICARETASLYLGEVQVTASSQNAFLASAPGVVGTINVLKGSYGTRNPESVQEFKGNVFWYDRDNAKYIQYGINGLFPVSNYKFTRFWKQFSEAYAAASTTRIEDWGSRPFVFTGIDPALGELLVSVPRVLQDPPKGYLPDYPNEVYPFDVWDGRAKSLVYKLFKEPNFWSSPYQIFAENFIYAGDKLYSFKDGSLYQHNSETDQCTFYGVKYQPAIMFTENKEPALPKVWNNIALSASKIPIETYFRTEDPYIQSSDLKDFDPWSTPEGVLYCYIYNDKLTPSATGLLPDALMLGDKMRGPVLFVMLRWDAPVRLRFVNIGFDKSKGHSI